MNLKFLVVGVSALAVTACTTTDPVTGETRPNYTGRGVLLGAATGAVLGYLTNTSDSDEGRTNALIGAGIGALAGGAIGNYMDRQEAAMRDALSDTGVGVRREGNNLMLIMPGDVTFATNSSDITPQFYAILNDVSDVLNRFPATYVDVIGHTDSTGPAEYNQTLSEQRALSVGGYLIAQDVLRDRLYIAGMGERALLISPETNAMDRQRNRRVEILIRPHTTS